MSINDIKTALETLPGSRGRDFPALGKRLRRAGETFQLWENVPGAQERLSSFGKNVSGARERLSSFGKTSPARGRDFPAPFLVRYASFLP